VGYAYNFQHVPELPQIQILSMMAATVWASQTREAGIASHLFAAAACGAAWARSGRASRLAPALGVLELFLVLDAAFNWRWLAHGFLMNAALEQHLYGKRELPQEFVLALLVGIMIAAVVLTLRYFRGRPGARLSNCGALISVAFWVIEVISLHATDAFLQHAVGPIMLIALVWIVSSSMIAVGILWDLKRHSKNKRPI
jgi:hypothetical protein